MTTLYWKSERWLQVYEDPAPTRLQVWGAEDNDDPVGHVGLEKDMCCP